jgi:hypothetical protein
MRIRSRLANMATLASAAVFSHGREARKGKHSYQKLPTTENQNMKDRRKADDFDDETHVTLSRHFTNFQKQERRRFIIVILGVVGILAFLFIAASYVHYVLRTEIFPYCYNGY